MENSRETFLRKINDFIVSAKIAPDKNAIKSKYLELVKEYHPDTNKELDKNILNEYMVIINNSFEKIMNGKTGAAGRKNRKSSAREFDFDIFLRLLTGIAEMGITGETAKNRTFAEYKKLMILEIEKSSKYAAGAFELLLSGETIGKNQGKIGSFNSGLVYYMYLLKSDPAGGKEKYENMPNRRIANKQTEKVADSYLAEYKSHCKDDTEKDAVEIVMEWLKETKVKYGRN
jgi:curved DNA-binding protein CbpA